jgi:L-alanine-DL-glutamate epimerase-like enolase superfamily enzyme
MNHSIKHIRIFRMNIPLKYPFIISLETITSAQNVLVMMETHSGLFGYGECSPYQKIHNETQDSCIHFAKQIAPNLLGVNPWDIIAWQKAINNNLAGQNCIKSAFDMALYDLSAQIAGLPLYAYLGGNNTKIMFTDMTVGIESPDNMAAEAKKYVEDAFPAIKIKLGTNFHDDVQRVKKVREAIGVNIPLRIDANQGWDVQTALEILTEIVPFGVEYCEQPVKATHFKDMTYLHQHSRTLNFELDFRNPKEYVKEREPRSTEKQPSSKKRKREDRSKRPSDNKRKSPNNKNTGTATTIPYKLQCKRPDCIARRTSTNHAHDKCRFKDKATEKPYPNIG